MRYHRNGKIFKFKSEYIVKIIDYGRNYFNNGTTNTKEIIEIVIDNKKDFQERIKKNGRTFVHFGTEKI
jgi:hypothetical protein